MGPVQVRGDDSNVIRKNLGLDSLGLKQHFHPLKRTP